MQKDSSRKNLLNYLEKEIFKQKNINKIGYRLFHKGGKHVGLSTDGRFDQYFTSNMLNSCEKVYEDELTKVIRGEQNFFLRIGRTLSSSSFYQQLCSNKIRNVVIYYKKNMSSVEGFYYCCSNSENASELINSINLVKSFSQEVSEVMKTENFFPFYDGKINLKNLFIPTRLSEREKICFAWYTAGISMKEIGRNLSISSRTVETYIYRAKEKLGLKNKNQIISNFFSNRNEIIR